MYQWSSDKIEGFMSMVEMIDLFIEFILMIYIYVLLFIAFYTMLPIV